jgi:hypothetical protein
MADRHDERYRDDRGFTERAGDEVRSWFGDEDAARRRRMDEERYGRDAEWARRRDWGHQMGLDYERRPGREWHDRDRTYGYDRAYGSAGYGRGFGMTSTGMPYAQPHEWRQNDREGFAGRAPRGYSRSDDRIREDVCDRLTDDPWIDPTEVEIQVRNGEVTLSGTVRDRSEKRRTEDIIESISGVRHVHNNLRVGAGTIAAQNPTRVDRG